MGKTQPRGKNAEKRLSDNGRFRQDGSGTSRPKLGCGFSEQGSVVGGDFRVVEPGVVNDKIEDAMRLDPLLLRCGRVGKDRAVFRHRLVEFESFIIAIRVENGDPRVAVPVVDQEAIVIPQGVGGVPRRIALRDLFGSERRGYGVEICAGPRLRYLISIFIPL